MTAPEADVTYLRPPLAWLRLAEPPPDPLSEAELSLIWQGQRFPPEALATPTGQPVRVLNPGRLNRGPGPDFRDAVLVLSERQLRGDVELHVRASAFRAHGHDSDAAYDGVALHVVYLADDGEATRLSHGGTAPVAAFAPWLERRRADIEAWLAAPALWREPCRDAEARLGGAAISAALQAAGEQRFSARTAAMTDAIAEHGAAQALWQALLASLGAGGDRPGFRRLAAALPASLAARLVDGLDAGAAWERLEQALLAVAGLRPPPPELQDRLTPPLHPPLARIGRPLNWPDRRLAALARLFVRAGGDIAAYASRGVADARQARELVSAWCVAAEAGPALLGTERAQELLVNAVLPFAAAQPELAARARALMVALRPLPPYSKTAFLEANLRPPEGKRRAGSAVEQQGLLGLLAEWCSQGGCGRCPLS